MPRNPAAIDNDRREVLRTMLVRLRDETYQRIRTFRQDQEQESEPAPGDEMDAAKASAEVETHASLIASAEEKLKYLDDALSRLDEGKYGSCMQCHEAIPIERLLAVPFALYCVNCQQTQKGPKVRWSEGGTIPPYDQQWTPPEEMEEAGAREYHLTGADEELNTHLDTPFGPEEPTEPVSATRRGGATTAKKQNQ